MQPVSLLPILLVAAALAAQTPPGASASRAMPRERFPAELDRYIENVRTQWQIPGIAIAVVRNDTTLVAKGYGVRALGKPERVDENTVFDIASLAKSFTATAAAILVDRGVLRWDDPVYRWRPDIVLPTESLTVQATLRDFLSHRTGLEPANMMWVPTAVTREEVLKRMRFLRRAAPFRQAMLYSNIGYSVAGEAMAAAAKAPFETLLRDLLIKPLGLRSTTWTYDQAATMANVASAHATIGGTQQVIPRELQRQAIAPAAAVQSSASDLTRWMRLHLNGGVLDGVRYVSDSAMRAIHSIQTPIPTTPAMRAARMAQDTVIGYGMGIQRMDYRGHPMLWHTGNGNGQIAWMSLFPREELGIVVMVNSWSAPMVHQALINRIADTYLGYEPRDWAAEAFARLPAGDSARARNERAMLAMRTSAPKAPPLRPFTGMYLHPVFGPVHVRTSDSSLTLQMGEGRIADLEYHGADAFYTVWRDPFMREFYGTHIAFTRSGDSIVAFTTTMNRDTYTAWKDGAPTLQNPARAAGPGVEAILGRWNLRLLNVPDVFTNWLEVERSGSRALVGRYVGLIGGARPIGRVDWSDGTARFTIPTEWELPGELKFEIRPVPGTDSVTGTMVRADGTMISLVGKRAPILLHAPPVAWTTPVPLFNGRDFTGWVPAPTARSLPNFWIVRDGALVNDGEEGVNLMTVQRFNDFKLHAEFRLPTTRSAGIFPRGRYWVILHDLPDPVPFKGTMGAVHRFLVPSQNASLGVNVWQSIDITLVGRRITIVVNGKTVTSNEIIPGTTGSAIDGDEAAPGPIMLQGEERRVEFRNITISVPVGERVTPIR